MDLTVQPSVATVKAEAPALWIRGIVPVDAHTVGSGTAAIYVGCIPQEIRTYLQLAMPVNHI